MLELRLGRFSGLFFVATRFSACHYPHFDRHDQPVYVELMLPYPVLPVEVKDDADELFGLG